MKKKYCESSAASQDEALTQNFCKVKYKQIIVDLAKKVRHDTLCVVERPRAALGVVLAGCDKEQHESSSFCYVLRASRRETISRDAILKFMK